jgi:hypothetical protein
MSLIVGRNSAAAVLAVAWLAVAGGNPAGAAEPRIAPNFTLYNHTNGQPVRLYDLAGSVVLLEFFWSQCGVCMEATPVVKSAIHDHFQTIAGNADGIPVTVLYVSVASTRTEVDTWMQTYGLDFVVDDTPQLETYDLYGGGGTPKFVVINGVTNSTTHRPWEILYDFSGFDEVSTVPTLAAHINAVRGTLLPELSNFRIFTNTTFRAAFRAQKGRTNIVEATKNWGGWTTITNIVGSNTVRVFDSGMPQNPKRYYRVRVQ